MGEHLPCKQGVKGSNPFISTLALRGTDATTVRCETGKLAYTGSQMSGGSAFNECRERAT